MENARAKQSKTWKISILGYGMKKRFLLVRNMAQTYESHRLQKYVWDYLSLVTLSLVFYLFMLFMLSLFVLVLVFLVAAWAPITNHCAILFQLYHLKTRSIFPFRLRCCSVLFFSISFIVFFILFFFLSFGVLLWVLRLELFQFDAFSTYSIRWNSKCWHVSCMFADFTHNYNAIAWKTISFRFDRVLL